MRLHLERPVSKAGAVTCVTEPGLVNTPLTMSSCTSAAVELMFVAEIFSAMSLATASGSPTAAPPNRVGTENTVLLLPQAHATCWPADNCLVVSVPRLSEDQGWHMSGTWSATQMESNGA